MLTLQSNSNMEKTFVNVEYIDHMGTDRSVVAAARVSFANANDEERTEEQDAKLIKYLAKHHHWTPFAHTSLTLRMSAPLPIRTQCFKHKSGFVENEESRRYISSKPTYYVPQNWRHSVDNKKQGSGAEFEAFEDFVEDTFYYEHMNNCIEMYEDALDRGVCEEQARFYLPQGCIVNWYWTGSIAAFARFFNQRTDTHAQYEIQLLAEMVGDIIQPLFPISWKELTTK